MSNVVMTALELRYDGCGGTVHAIPGIDFVEPYKIGYKFHLFGNQTPLAEFTDTLIPGHIINSTTGERLHSHHRDWVEGADFCVAYIFDSRPSPKQVTQFNTRFPAQQFTAAEFNAAVAANVAAQTAALQTAYTNAQTQITQLQTQVSQLQQGNVNLQQLEADGTILMPKRRTGAYTIKDFTVLNAIYRTGNPPHFNKRDLDFIDVQMLSVQQAVRKMYQIGVAKQNDLNTSAIYRRRSNRLEEYSATMQDDMVEYLFECVRIMNYCVDEIRFKQFFNLNNPTLLRIIEPKP